MNDDAIALTAQQQLALDQKYRALEQTGATFSALEAKALGLLQIATLVTTVQGGLALFGAETCTGACATWAPVFTLASLLFLGLLIWRATASIKPREYQLPGTTNLDAVYYHIVNTTLDTAFDGILTQVNTAIVSARKNNETKAAQIREATAFLYVLIAMVAITIILRMFTP